MYKGSLSLRKEFVIHLVFWLIWTYYSILVLEDNTLKVGQMHLFYVTGIIVYVITFYVNYLFVLPRIFHPFRWRKAVIGFLVIFLFFSFLRYLVEQVITLHLLDTRNYTADTHIVTICMTTSFTVPNPLF